MEALEGRATLALPRDAPSEHFDHHPNDDRTRQPRGTPVSHYAALIAYVATEEAVASARAEMLAAEATACRAELTTAEMRLGASEANAAAAKASELALKARVILG